MDWFLLHNHIQADEQMITASDLLPVAVAFESMSMSLVLSFLPLCSLLFALLFVSVMRVGLCL